MTLAPTAEEREADLVRFKREIKCQASLDHPGIAPILAVNLKDSPPWFVMPLASGTVRDLLNEHPNGLPENEAMRIFVGVLEAMEYAHAEHVIHRDIKPENILLIDGKPVLADFGIGRRLQSDSTTLTVANRGMGSLGYSAPEQLTDAHGVDHRADIYALGRVLHELLCGKNEIFHVDLDAIPARFRYIVMKATQQQADRRFDTAAEMAREIALLVGGGEQLLAPGDRAKSIIQKLASRLGTRKAEPKLAELARVLIDNSDDLQLYLHVFTNTPEAVLAALAEQFPHEYRQIMDVFDSYAEGGHPWSFTDTLAIFLSAAYRSTSQLHVHEQILNRLLILGHEHNRWFVGKQFVALAIDAMTDSSYVSVIAGILRENPSAIPFVADELRSHALPPLVAQLLRN
ncbi:Serine/threonine-protein kinase PknD [Clavibacter nebraskensis]